MSDTDGLCAFGLCHFFIRCDTGYRVEKSYYRACLLNGIHILFFLQSSRNWIVQLYNPRKYMQILKITMVFGLLQYLQYSHQTAACESWQSMHPRRQCPWRIMTSSFSSNDLGEGWMAINNCCRLTLKKHTLLGTNIPAPKALLKMILPFPRWNMLVPRRVTFSRKQDLSGFVFEEIEGWTLMSKTRLPYATVYGIHHLWRCDKLK